MMKQLISFLLTAVALISAANKAHSVTITTAASGNWSSTSTWTGGVLPEMGDSVVIAHTITLNVKATVARIQINSGSLAIRDSLTVGTIRTNNGYALTNYKVLTVFDTLLAPVFNLYDTAVVNIYGVHLGDQYGGYLQPNTTTNYLGGNQAINGGWANYFGKVNLLGTGTKTCSGNYNTIYGLLYVAPGVSFTLSTGLYIGHLTVDSAASFQFSEWLNLSGTLTVGKNASFSNTYFGGFTVNGSFTLSSGATMNVSYGVTFKQDVTIETGATLTASCIFQKNLVLNGQIAPNYSVTFSGADSLQQVTGSGSINAGTGQLTVSKSSGIFRFGVNTTSTNFWVRDIGAQVVVDLGVGTTHTVNSYIAFPSSSAGTLRGNGSTLYLNGFSLNGGSGSQFLADSSLAVITSSFSINNPITFYNARVTGSGSIGMSNMTVQNVLSMAGTITVSSAPQYGPFATLEYNTSSPYTVGAEWPNSSFTAGGGVRIRNTGALTLNANKTAVLAKLQIDSGSAFSLSSFSLTTPFLRLGGTDQAASTYGGTSSAAAVR